MRMRLGTTKLTLHTAATSNNSVETDYGNENFTGCEAELVALAVTDRDRRSNTVNFRVINRIFWFSLYALTLHFTFAFPLQATD